MGRMPHSARRLMHGRSRPVRVALLVALAAWCIQAASQTASDHRGADTRTSRDLSQLSLEQLSAIVVTSVSRRRERLADVSSSVFVISARDIQRSGATTIGEALRLAPNLNVARADTAQYAISARGFNNVLANKMLVLIDGRAVYSPLFSGVFWESQHVMLEDVERIEVISGPGATIWGSNAVNGVIDIITRASRDTQGALVSAGLGNREKAVAARYGGTLGERGHYASMPSASTSRNPSAPTARASATASSTRRPAFVPTGAASASSFPCLRTSTKAMSAVCPSPVTSRAAISWPGGTSSSRTAQGSGSRDTTTIPSAITRTPSRNGSILSMSRSSIRCVRWGRTC